MIDSKTLESLRKEYPKGLRVELVKMDDVQAPPIGTKGTVRGVDDIGSILVSWDNGSSLNVVYGEDEVKVVEQIKTECYGKIRFWINKEDAIKFFSECCSCSEGSEKERYFHIIEQLLSGKTYCKDI